MDKVYNMKQASELLGMTVRHIQRLDKEGLVHCIRTPGGRRRITESEIKRLRNESLTVPPKEHVYALYARVSSFEQKSKGDLKRQVQTLKHYLPPKIKPDYVLEDVASGLNEKRKGLLKLMQLAKEGKITDLFLTNKDRLARFGYDYLFEYFRSYNVDIHILEEQESLTIEAELVQDLLSILTSFSGRLYGIRSAKRKKFLKEVEEFVSSEEVQSDKKR